MLETIMYTQHAGLQQDVVCVETGNVCCRFDSPVVCHYTLCCWQQPGGIL
jgi:hypothetical protein